MNSNEIVILKSRFIARIVPVKSEDEAQKKLLDTRLLYPLASHYCYAYIIGDQGEIQKASDDGEPQKTAGIPILEVLKKHQVTNVIAIVVRYFGGTLLGSSGLIRAYSKAVSTLFDNIEYTSLYHMLACEMTVSYSAFAEMERYLKDQVVIDEISYLENVKIKFSIQREYFAGFQVKIQGILREKDIIKIIEEYRCYQ